MTLNEQKAFWLACVAAYVFMEGGANARELAEAARCVADAKLAEAVKHFGDGRQST